MIVHILDKGYLCLTKTLHLGTAYPRNEPIQCNTQRIPQVRYKGIRLVPVAPFDLDTGQRLNTTLKIVAHNFL